MGRSYRTTEQEKRMVRCLESILIGRAFYNDKEKNECVVSTADGSTIIHIKKSINRWFPPQKMF